MKGRAIDTRLIEPTYADIAELCHVTTINKPENQRTPINGTVAGLTVPEILDNTRTKRFTGMKDFPLSKGEPMVIIENTEQNMVLFVPARSIKYLARQPGSVEPDIE